MRTALLSLFPCLCPQVCHGYRFRMGKYVSYTACIKRLTLKKKTKQPAGQGFPDDKKYV